MQAATPLVYEFQLNGRVELTVLATGLHQSNLTTTVDIVGINGVDFDPANCDSTAITNLKAAVQALVIATKAVPS